MSDRPTPWGWIKHTLLYGWAWVNGKSLRLPFKNWVKASLLCGFMWAKAIPLMLLPAWVLGLIGTDDDKECAEINRDLATLTRLLKRKD
jgi:hypothetical protein